MTIRDIANAARGRRIQLGLSQADAARRADVSRKWLVEFEAGKPTAQLLQVLRLLDALGLELTVGSDSPGAASNTAIDLDELLREHDRA